MKKYTQWDKVGAHVPFGSFSVGVSVGEKSLKLWFVGGEKCKV